MGTLGLLGDYWWHLGAPCGVLNLSAPPTKFSLGQGFGACRPRRRAAICDDDGNAHGDDVDGKDVDVANVDVDVVGNGDVEDDDVMHDWRFTRRW